MTWPILLEACTVADYESWEGGWELIQGQPLDVIDVSCANMKIVVKIVELLSS